MWRVTYLAAVLALAFLGPSQPYRRRPSRPSQPSHHAHSPSPKDPARTRLVENYGKLPMAFEKNEGQVDEQVKFLARGLGYALYLLPTEAAFSLTRPDTLMISRNSNLAPPNASPDPPLDIVCGVRARSHVLAERRGAYAAQI